MINNTYKEKFYENSLDRQFEISYDGGAIINEMLHSENFELSESLCSESELKFGCCEANSIKFRVSNVVGSLKDKWLTVKIRLANVSEDAFILGKYKVYSDTPTADRSYRDIVAYDKMYEIINKNVATWYNGLTFPMTLKTFRDSFCNYVGIMQEDAVLVNDSMQVEKTIEGDEISGKDILTAICEINGVFGNVGRDGKLKYVALDYIISGLYPANDLFPANNLYPRVENTELIKKAYYKTCDYEDFITRNIQKIVIRMEQDDIGCAVGTDGNTYVVENNFLVFGKTAEVLNNIGNNLLSVIRYTAYRPFNAECVGNPCIELGDKIRLHTKTEVIETYLLNRVMRGIQAFSDSISADGTETYADNVNSLNRQITKLQGKTVKLETDANGIRMDVENLSTETQTSLNVLDGRISSEVARAEGKENELSSSINQTAESIRSEVKNVNDSLSSSISQTSEEIRAEVTRATGVEGTLSSNISQTAEAIRTEVARATRAEGDLSSNITQTANSITQEVARTYKTIDVATEDYKSIRRDAQGYATTAQNSANSYTDNKLTVYSTTAQVKSLIQQTENSIVSTVTQNTETQITNALASYSTTSQMNTAIKQYADGIKLEATSYTDSQLTSYASISLVTTTVSNAVSDKITSSEANTIAGNVFDTKISQIQITADQISLEGYTTINGGFSIDNYGYCHISGNSSEVTMHSGALVIKDTRNNIQGSLSPYRLTLSSNDVISTMSSGEYLLDVDYFDNGTTWLPMSSIITTNNISAYIPKLPSGTILTTDNISSNLPSNVITTSNIGNYVPSGGSWEYLQLEDYAGDEVARYFYTK